MLPHTQKKFAEHCLPRRRCPEASSPAAPRPWTPRRRQATRSPPAASRRSWNSSPCCAASNPLRLCLCLYRDRCCACFCARRKNAPCDCDCDCYGERTLTWHKRAVRLHSCTRSGHSTHPISPGASPAASPLVSVTAAAAFSAVSGAAVFVSISAALSSDRGGVVVLSLHRMLQRRTHIFSE